MCAILGDRKDTAFRNVGGWNPESCDSDTFGKLAATITHLIFAASISELRSADLKQILSSYISAIDVLTEEDDPCSGHMNPFRNNMREIATCKCLLLSRLRSSSLTR